jgi:hypothetical protein
MYAYVYTPETESTFRQSADRSEFLTNAVYFVHVCQKFHFFAWKVIEGTGNLIR